MSKTEPVARQPKDLRYREQLFKDAKDLVFDTEERGFIPLPIILRKMMKHLTPPELRIYVYLALRASKFAICYPTTDEMIHELGLLGTKNLTPHIKSLVEKRLISTATMSGRKFYLVHHPRVALQWLVNEGRMGDAEFIETNDLLADFGRPPLQERVAQRKFRLDE